MAEVTMTKTQVWSVIEIGVLPRGEVNHGTYDDEGEAWARYDAVLRQQPGLGVTGSLQVRGRLVETVRPPAAEKMRRAGRDYEDKAVGGPAR